MVPAPASGAQEASTLTEDRGSRHLTWQERKQEVGRGATLSARSLRNAEGELTHYSEHSNKPFMRDLPP